jgi:DNA-binding transcriptional regulator/RsmH inhibitor MraZ
LNIKIDYVKIFVISGVVKMFGENILIGYSLCNVDEKNRIYLPKFTSCEPGDELLILPEDDHLAICSSALIDEYYKKIESIKDAKEKIVLYNELRKCCESFIHKTVVDKSKRISLSKNIKFEEPVVEIRGSGDRIVVSGKFSYPSIYRKRV